MITLKPMSEKEFEEFKVRSQTSYSKHLSIVEKVPFEEAIKNAREQFNRLVPEGLGTANQFFYDVLETDSKEVVGFLWLGIQDRLGRKVMSINDIHIYETQRGKKFGSSVMKEVERVAREAGVKRIRLHVFADNEAACRLYQSAGFKTSSLDMHKEL